MNIQLPVHMDKQAFLDWVRGREERYELVDGRPVMMVGASLNHGRIVGNLYYSLRRKLGPEWETLTDFGLDAAPKTLRYPDIMVQRSGADGANYTSVEPCLLIEVLSPSSASLDLGDKASEYLRLPSLLGYVVVSQDEPKAWAWLRKEEAFPPSSIVIAGIEATISIPGLGIDLPLSEVYESVRFG